MKKMMKISIIYAILAMIAGVFFREFTKFNNYEGITTLAKMHTHLFILGMIMFLIIALFCTQIDLVKEKKFKVFLITYNIGVSIMIIMMLVRGIFQVKGITPSIVVNATISGFSGIGHTLTGIGILILLFTILKVISKKEKEKEIKETN